MIFYQSSVITVCASYSSQIQPDIGRKSRTLHTPHLLLTAPDFLFFATISTKREKCYEIWTLCLCTNGLISRVISAGTAAGQKLVFSQPRLSPIHTTQTASISRRQYQKLDDDGHLKFFSRNFRCRWSQIRKNAFWEMVGLLSVGHVCVQRYSLLEIVLLFLGLAYCSKVLYYFSPLSFQLGTCIKLNCLFVSFSHILIKKSIDRLIDWNLWHRCEEAVMYIDVPFWN